MAVKWRHPEFGVWEKWPFLTCLASFGSFLGPFFWISRILGEFLRWSNLGFWGSRQGIALVWKGQNGQNPESGDSGFWPDSGIFWDLRIAWGSGIMAQKGPESDPFLGHFGHFGRPMVNFGSILPIGRPNWPKVGQRADFGFFWQIFKYARFISKIWQN